MHRNRKGVVLFLLALGIQAGATAGAQPSGSSPVTIERVAPGRWRASYTLAAPVDTLRFERPAAFHRERVWQVLTPGYEWARDSGAGQVTQVLRATGAPHREIVFEFGEFADALPKEYELFEAFTDGSVAIYTGHFFATPVGRDALGTGPPIHTVRVIPPSGTSVVVRGRVSHGPVTFTDSVGDGTYVYVGNIVPRETLDVIAIVDPGMPAWLRTQFDRYLPRIFAAYARRFGAKLPWKPEVIYGFKDTTSSGLSSGGGTLTGLVSLALEGAAWRTPSADATAQAFHLLAHESAHLWNGQLVESAGGPASWMHEGGADAMASALLLEFGIIDSARFRSDRDRALNACVADVAAGSVHSAGSRGAFSTFYDCGEVMALWTDAAVRQARPGADVFTFWRDLVAAAVPGRRYDEDMYFAVLERDGVAASRIAPMRAFLDATDFSDAAAGLGDVGVTLVRGGTPPASSQQSYARAALAHLMASACGGRVNFNWGRVAVTGPLRGCAPFEATLRVAAMDGLRLADQGAAVHDDVEAKCAAGAEVRLAGEDGATVASVACTRPLAPLPPWYEWPVAGRAAPGLDRGR